MDVITSDMLIKRGACSVQRQMFVKAFGTSVTVTEELVKQYPHFDYEWAVYNLLNSTDGMPVFLKILEPAEKTFNEVSDASEKTYEKTVTPARNAYNEAVSVCLKQYGDFNMMTDEGRKAYYEAMKPSEETYQKVVNDAAKAHNATVTPAELTYSEARAVAFARAFIAQKEL